MKTIGGVKLNDIKSEAEINGMIDTATRGNYKSRGEIKFSELPELSEAVLGFAWDITTNFTSDERFVDGGNQFYTKGSNVVVIEDPEGNYKFDVFAAPNSESATEEDINGIIDSIYNP